MLVAIVTFRGRCRIAAISKTKLLVAIVNGFYLLKAKAQELHTRCGMDRRFAAEICNGKVLFVTKYKVAFSILTVIIYDSVVLTLIAEN